MAVVWNLSSPRHRADYFPKHASYYLDIYKQIYDRFIPVGDFNLDEIINVLCLNFYAKNDSENLFPEKTCFKNPYKPSCIKFFITNRTSGFQNSTSKLNQFSNWFILFSQIESDCLKSTFQKVKPKAVICRNVKHSD